VKITARVVVLPVDDIDTDQIIPARFLKVTDREGLGDALFADWRYRDDGTAEPSFALNRADAAGAGILIAGHNFGCGSSREHAAWALRGWGIRAVVSTGFADIFRNNALTNGVVPVELAADGHARLSALGRDDPNTSVTVDVEACAVVLPDGSTLPFPLDPFARDCLLRGVDRLGYLLAHEDDIGAFEASHAIGPDTTTVSA
jgi:3-isopropylmalate/(R)-2-methylmalate dehydratase small subunit